MFHWHIHKQCDLAMWLFVVQKDFFQLKELEKIAPKEKGISKCVFITINTVLVLLHTTFKCLSPRTGSTMYAKVTI